MSCPLIASMHTGKLRSAGIPAHRDSGIWGRTFQPAAIRANDPDGGLLPWHEIFQEPERDRPAVFSIVAIAEELTHEAWIERKTNETG